MGGREAPLRARATVLMLKRKWGSAADDWRSVIEILENEIKAANKYVNHHRSSQGINILADTATHILVKCMHLFFVLNLSDPHPQSHA